MPEGSDLEALFLQNVSVIERIATSICRRHGLSREDTEDFASSFTTRLIETGYAALGKFRGDSTLTTYLTVVIAMAFRDYRAQKWGRWRPSAVARAGGPIAVRLEALVYRDGLSFNQAVETLRSTGERNLSVRDFADMLARFPRRAPMRPVEVGQEALAGTASGFGADERVSTDADDDERAAVEAALVRALEKLPAEERLMLRMHYWERLSIADVARALALPQKSLYRRIDRALMTLRAQLEASGVSKEQAQSVAGTIGP